MLGLRLATLALVLPILTACGGAATRAAVDPMPLPTQAQSEPELESSPLTPAAPTTGDILGTINPCELLSADEIETFFGEPAEPGATPSTLGGYHSCMITNQSGGKLITLALTYQTAEQFKAEKEASVAMLDLEMVPVDGLGDEAVFYSGVLRVRVGETVLQVLTWHSDLDAALALTRQIAGLALPRLP